VNEGRPRTGIEVLEPPAAAAYLHRLGKTELVETLDVVRGDVDPDPQLSGEPGRAARSLAEHREDPQPQRVSQRAHVRGVVDVLDLRTQTLTGPTGSSELYGRP
jgi:hypothetical protein